MSNKRNEVLSFLKEARDANNKTIKKLEEGIRDDRFLKTTITGGAFANAARSSIDRSISGKQAELRVVEERNSWINAMLSKYH